MFGGGGGEDCKIMQKTRLQTINVNKHMQYIVIVVDFSLWLK